MRFGQGDSADSSTVEDRRGFPGGRVGMAGGGLGIVGVLIVVLVRALGGTVDDGTSGAPPNGAPPSDPRGPTPSHNTQTSAALSGSCEGVTSTTDQGKFIACVETNVQSFWRNELAKSNKGYQVAKLVLFTARTDSGCGAASASTGPFYCPTDGKVYLDLGFFQAMTTRGNNEWSPLSSMASVMKRSQIVTDNLKTI